MQLCLIDIHYFMENLYNLHNFSSNETVQPQKHGFYVNETSHKLCDRSRLIPTESNCAGGDAKKEIGPTKLKGEETAGGRRRQQR